MDYDLISAPSNAIFLPPLLLRPFDAAHRINPIAERAIDRLDRTAPDIGMARRGAGTHLVHSGPRVLAKAAGRRSADFLVPLIGNGLPQPLPIALAEPADPFQNRAEPAVGIGGGTLGRLGRRRDRGTHARRTAALDRGNRGGLLSLIQRSATIDSGTGGRIAGVRRTIMTLPSPVNAAPRKNAYSPDYRPQP